MASQRAQGKLILVKTRTLAVLLFAYTGSPSVSFLFLIMLQRMTVDLSENVQVIFRTKSYFVNIAQSIIVEEVHSLKILETR